MWVLRRTTCTQVLNVDEGVPHRISTYPESQVKVGTADTPEPGVKGVVMLFKESPKDSPSYSTVFTFINMWYFILCRQKDNSLCVLKPDVKSDKYFKRPDRTSK